MHLLLALPLLLGVFVPYRQMTSLAATKPFPVVTAKAYTARIMISIQDKGLREYAIEKYDQNMNKASLAVLKGDDKAQLILMDYDEDNMYLATYSWSTGVPTACYIIDMLTARDDPTLGDVSDNFNFFGGWQGGQRDGKPHMFSSRDIFKMGGQNPFVYQGTKTVDGIVADWWSTSIKWSSDSDSLNVNYYFTPDDWKVTGYKTDGGAFPIRIEVSGKYTNGGTTKMIKHFYEYVNFETSDALPVNAFSLPEGIPCSFLKGNPIVKPAPTIPDVVSYSRELVDASGNVKLEDVIHDKKNGFLRIISGAANILYDFNDGVRYSLDDKGRCARRAIDPDLDLGVDAKGGFIQDNGPSEFSPLNDKFVFTGTTITRQMASYAWGGTVNGQPYDVHFAKRNWNFPGQSTNSTPPPLSMINNKIHYNFFDFQPKTKYVLSSGSTLNGCKLTSGIKFFKLSFFSDRSYVPKGTYSNKEDKDMIRSAIAKAAGVKYLHVSLVTLKWDKDTQHLDVTIKVYGPTQPQYLYRRTDEVVILGADSMPIVKLDKIAYDKAVKKGAQLCEDNASHGKFLCRNFDLCNSTDGSYTLTMHKALPKTATVSGSVTCSHFARNIDGKVDISLNKAVTNLKNAVQSGKLKVTVRYESRYGYKHTAKLTAFKIQNNIFRRRSQASRRAVRKFWYYGSDYSIIKTETLTSIRTSQDCASECLGRTEYECKTYSFCRGTNQCTLSKSPPQKAGQRSNCPIRARLYTTDFMWMRGKTAVTIDQVTFRNVGSINQCAEKCLKYTKYKCESLDYCYKTRACVLHNTHIYALAQNQIQNITTRGCYHLSKRYLLDFQVTSNTALRSDDPKNFEVVSVSTPDQCAYLCRTSYSGQGGCVQFDFCSSNKQCHIVSAKTQKYVSSKAKSDCDTFTLAVTANVQAQSSSSSGYSNGSFAGLAIGMIIIGVAFGGLIMYILHKKRILHKIVAH